MRVRALIGVVLGLALLSCGSPEQPLPSLRTGVPTPIRCDAPEGSVVDVAHEPDWRQGDDRFWATSDGCLVRIDVIADFPGPAHCGWQSARVIVTGIPVGARYSDDRNSATYVRDPGDVFGDASTAAGFDPDAALPARAVDTGFREGGTALWVDENDESVIYLVTATSIERWPRDPQPAGCA